MKVSAIIAEYNPFHMGHAYQIREVRARSACDYLIVLMSGDFVQRGTPAVFDKFTRAEMAARCGADLVLQLPLAAACGSADRFAEGAVCLLNRLGVVDELWFGSECGEIEPFLSCAKLLAGESPAYAEALKRALKQGLCFPAAREAALKSAGFPDGSHLHDLLSLPNNSLGLAYCIQLKKTGSRIIPKTLKRTGAGYHDLTADPTAGYPSAGAIRSLLLKGSARTGPAERLTGLVPDPLLPLYEQMLTESVTLTIDDFSDQLAAQLLQETPESLTGYLDISEDLANRIIRHRHELKTISSFTALLKTRDRTYTSVSRALLHILLKVRTGDGERLRSPAFARILAFRPCGPLMKAIQEGNRLPLYTNPASLGDAYHKEWFASALYEQVQAKKSGRPVREEYRRKIAPIRAVPQPHT